MAEKRCFVKLIVPIELLELKLGLPAGVEIELVGGNPGRQVGSSVFEILVSAEVVDQTVEVSRCPFVESLGLPLYLVSPGSEISRAFLNKDIPDRCWDDQAKYDATVWVPGEGVVARMEFDVAAAQIEGWRHTDTDGWWESCEPGRTAEDTLAGGGHEHKTLQEAIDRAIPEWCELGLTFVQAALVAFSTGLVLSTGCEIIEDENEGEQYAIGGGIPVLKCAFCDDGEIHWEMWRFPPDACFTCKLYCTGCKRKVRGREALEEIRTGLMKAGLDDPFVDVRICGEDVTETHSHAIGWGMSEVPVLHCACGGEIHWEMEREVGHKGVGRIAPRVVTAVCWDFRLHCTECGRKAFGQKALDEVHTGLFELGLDTSFLDVKICDEEKDEAATDTV